MRFLDLFIIVMGSAIELVLLGILIYVIAGYPSLTVRRSWFTFSIRSQFILMTLVGGWFAWNVHIVNQRKLLAAEIAACGGNVVKVDIAHWDSEHNGGYIPSVSLIRRWLGDEAIGFVDAQTEAPPSGAMRQAAKVSFPEALVVFGDWQH